MDAKFVNLFRFTNYKFSTKSPGRLSTLYFQDVQGIKGRWRRDHPGGEQLVYQGKCLRFFLSSGATEFFDPESALSTWMNIKDGLIPAGYSGHWKAGYHVWEMSAPSADISHGSGGKIMAHDPAAALAISGLSDQSFGGSYVDWTQMEGITAI